MRAADHKAVRAAVLAKDAPESERVKGCAGCYRRHTASVAESKACKHHCHRVVERPVDIRVENHGSIVLLQPLTVAGEQWLLDTFNGQEEVQWWARALVVEPRYVEDIVNGARSAGLEVR